MRVSWCLCWESVLLVALARSRAFNRLLTPLIEHSLARYTSLDLKDYSSLLHLRDDNRIIEVDIKEQTWLANQTIGELNLFDEGVRVLGVKRSGEDYIGAPPKDLRLLTRDQLVLYGRKHRMHKISGRASGNQVAHHESKAEHKKDLDEQRKQTNRMNEA